MSTKRLCTFVCIIPILKKKQQQQQRTAGINLRAQSSLVVYISFVVTYIVWC